MEATGIIIQQQSSVKIECTAKGLVQPTVHVYSNDADESNLEETRKKAIEQFEKTVTELRQKGFQIVGDQ